MKQSPLEDNKQHGLTIGGGREYGLKSNEKLGWSRKVGQTMKS